MKRAMVMIVVLMGLVLGALSASGMTRTAGNALLPEGRVTPTRTPREQPRPLYPGCGEILIGEGTCTTFDGYIDGEWENATVYDISDTCGQSDDLPNEPGSCILYLMRDEQAVYFAIDAVIDTFEDYYDGPGFYFDENDDGCWPMDQTNEGNIWVRHYLELGSFTVWRWWQDDNCSGCEFCLDYMPNYTDLGDPFIFETFDLGTGMASGHMQYEMGVYYGALADDEWEIQTYFNLGETCGFYVYCLDQYYYDFIGEMPCTGDASTYKWPCSWPTLIGMPKESVTLTPDATTAERGGTLGYTVEVTNNTGEDQTLQYWSEVYLWTGEPYKKNPVFGPLSGTLKAGQSKSGHIAHKIPNNAPLKTYTLYGRIGFHPDDIWDEDCFQFEVVEGMGYGHEGTDWEVIESTF